jgi:uncharacterized lipoprotein YbaY
MSYANIFYRYTTRILKVMMQTADSRIIEGEIVFEQLASSFSGAMARVRLEDISFADASSRIVAEIILRNVYINIDNPQPLHFSMSIPALEERLMYSLAVLVDIDGDNEISLGDYISKESYPVKKNFPSQYFRISVSPVM